MPPQASGLQPHAQLTEIDGVDIGNVVWEIADSIGLGDYCFVSKLNEGDPIYLCEWDDDGPWELLGTFEEVDISGADIFDTDILAHELQGSANFIAAVEGGSGERYLAFEDL